MEKTMYQQNPMQKTTIKVNNGYPAETIEEKVMRIMSNKEPIKDGATLIYTDRKDGVQPAYDIRTDRFEIALDGMDAVTKAQIARREGFSKNLDQQNKDINGKGNEGGAQSTQATEPPK